jgi:hypothetical protein
VLPPLVITVVGWSALFPAPGPGLDPSWLSGLYMSTHNGLTFGRDVAWTYGPLGFLTGPQIWETKLAELSFLYTLVIRFAFATAMFHYTRAAFSWIGAFVATLVVVSVGVGTFGAAELALVLMAANRALDPRTQQRTARILAVAVGVMAGLQLLLKVSTGFDIVAMAAILVIAIPGRRWRLAATAFAGFAVTMLVLWVLAGQALGGLPGYIKYGLQVSSGYSNAMDNEQAGLGWQYLAVLGVLAVGLWAAFITTADWRARARWALALIWLVLWFGWFKEGFIRHDGTHGAWGIDGLMVGFVAFRWRQGQRSMGLVCLGAVVIFALASEGQSLTGDVNPSRNSSAFFSDFKDFTSTSEQNSIQQAGRLAVRASDPIDHKMLSKLRGHTVAVYPIDLDLAWGYRLNWDPVPVLQSYTAYTTGLDALDASFLESSRAPQRILFEGDGTIDGRVAAFDQGHTIRTMLCHYQVIGTSTDVTTNTSLAVLAKVPDRCPGAPVRFAVVHANWGETVTVPKSPRGNWIVYARIYGTDPTGLARLGAVLYKPTDRFVEINGGGAQRFIEGTATDGLPLQIPPALDYPAPFNIGIAAKMIALTKGAGGLSGGKPLTYEFYAQRITL